MLAINLFHYSVMPCEETPLLEAKNDRDTVYQRFSPKTTNTIVAMVSGCAVLPSEWRCHIIADDNIWRLMMLLSQSFIVFVIGTFSPCIPEIAKDLDSTSAMVK